MSTSLVGGSSIRAQAKRSKIEHKSSQAIRPPADGRDRMDKEIVKAVLASPLIVPWPNIPKHLQNGILVALPKLITPDVAEYHLSRARCHAKERKTRRKSKTHSGDASEAVKGDATDSAEGPEEMDTSVEDTTAESIRPSPPHILNHLVLGINETIKALERNIDDLKERLTLIADKLNGISLPTRNDLLPTAPRSPSPEPSSGAGSGPSAPLGWVIVPLLSVNPQSLVSPIPQYCATYNSLVYQWGQLSKTVKTRLQESEWDVLGEEREEVRVVPLGDVEKEMAGFVGLRRLACMGVRTSHPDQQLLGRLLPKSVLHPPRHSITLPFPTSSKRALVSDSAANRPSKKAKPTLTLPLPHVHYAPLAIKGITTTVPTDGNARKQKRLEGVRAKRIEVKEKKKEDRRREFLRGIKGETRKGKVPRHGAKKGKKKSSEKNRKEPAR